MISHRLKEEVFLRIPLKAFGGLGKYFGKKPLKSTGADASNWVRDSKRTTSVTPSNESEESQTVSVMATIKHP